MAKQLRNMAAALVKHGYITQEESLQYWGVGSSATSCAGPAKAEAYAVTVLAGMGMSFQQAQHLLHNAEDKQQVFRSKLEELVKL